MNIVVDCESSGPCPMFGDLIEFAAVAENGNEFKSQRYPPIWNNFDPAAYKVLGITREEHLKFTGNSVDDFAAFHGWIMDNTEGGSKRATFWSDNPAYDWQWINWHFAGSIFRNPFGFSARRIGDLFAGANGNIKDATSWKKWRRTTHTHDPLDDARGNMEALKEIKRRFKL
jgi:hypothetical protein